MALMSLSMTRVDSNHVFDLFDLFICKMCDSNKNTRYFVCSYCGEKITKNIANLIRHENIHKTHKKVKCSAANCGKIMHQYNYRAHWGKQHKLTTMPTILNFVDVNGHQPRRSKKKKSHEPKEIKAENFPDKPNNFYVLNALGLIHKVETKVQNLYFVSEPSFGELIWPFTHIRHFDLIVFIIIW